MRSADISPATDEDRRREYREAVVEMVASPINLAEIKYRVRRAMEGDVARGNAIAHALAQALHKRSTK